MNPLPRLLVCLPLLFHPGLLRAQEASTPAQPDSAATGQAGTPEAEAGAAAAPAFFREAWRTPLPERVVAPPLLAGGRILVRTPGREILLFDRTGRLRGGRWLPETVSGKPLAVQADARALTLVSPTDGLRRFDLAQRTLTTLRGGAVTAAVLEEGWAYLAGPDGRVAAVALADGQTRWAHQSPTPAPHRLALAAPDLLFVSGGDGTLETLAREDGAARGTLPLSSPLASPVGGTDGTWVFGTADGAVQQLRRTGRRVRRGWRITTGAVTAVRPLVQPDLIGFAPRTNDLIAVSVRRGFQTWKTPLPGRVAVGGLALVAGWIVVVPEAGEAVHTFDPLTGQAGDTYALEEDFLSAPPRFDAGGRRLYLVTYHRRLIALDLGVGPAASQKVPAAPAPE